MQVGDLVTLSTYCLTTASMWKWKDRIWNEKKPLVGIVVEVVDNQLARTFLSKNEKTLYYVKWCGEGPGDRWNNRVRNKGAWSYFLRNDLKFVKKGKNESR
tara:strand:+ start:39 stop:341 length:303 start_codon:yes stop_codon:yes gene_type:complete